MANKGLKGNYYIPDNIKKRLQTDIDNGKGGKNRRRIIGYLNDGHMTDREIAKVLYDYKNNNLGSEEDLAVIEKLIKWMQSEVGGKAEHIYRTKKSQSDIGIENKHKKTHFKWGDDTKPIQFHNLVSIPKPEKMFENENNDVFSQMAVIYIKKPLDNMDLKYYVQAVPYPLQDNLYINRGSAKHKVISNKNVEVIEVFNSKEEEKIKETINKERIKRGLTQKDNLQEEIIRSKQLMGINNNNIKK